MKRILRAALAICVALLSVCFVRAGANPPASVSAAERTAIYDFSLTKYSVRMEISANRVIQVSEEISAEFNRSRHGIIRDLPLDKGVRYTDFHAAVDGVPIENEFHNDDSSLLSLYLRGGNINWGEEHRFSVSYRMTVPALREKNYLPLDVLGLDWQAPVSHFEAVIICPAEPVGMRIVPPSDPRETPASCEKNGNEVRIFREEETFGEGITVELQFEDGVLLPPPPDLAPLWVSLIALGLLAALLLLKAVFCRQPVLVRSVGLEAPDEMDPLRMGRIIDNKADSEDLGALVFYLAAQGYLTIDLTDSDDPLLAVTGKSLPPETPRHVRVFYDGLFRRRDRVRTSELTNTFYPVASAATKAVAEADGPLYRPRGNILLALFGILSVLFLGLFCLLYSRTLLGGGLFWAAFPVAALSYFVAAGGSVLGARLCYKIGRGKSFLIALGFFLLGCIPALSCFFVLNPTFSEVTMAVCAAGSSLVGACSGLLYVRTERYNALLGKVLGFADFIRYTERDRISFMLKDDPELYYKILPYAQVCGITDIWTEKFRGLDSPPPAWVYGGSDTLLDLMIWNSLFRSVNLSLARSFVSRPSNRGGGYHGGGFGGGSVGGGFGGGGGRSF